MGLQISGPDGRTAEVNSDSRLSVEAIITKKVAEVSRDKSDTYSWTAVSADIDAGDTGLLVCNDSKTKKLCIDKIYVWADVETQFKIHVPAYVTPAGTAVVGVNLNRTSSNEADATAKADETGNVFAAANVITTVRNTEGGTEEEGQWIDYDGALVLGYHHCVAVDIIQDPAAFEVTIIGHYE